MARSYCFTHLWTKISLAAPPNFLDLLHCPFGRLLINFNIEPRSHPLNNGLTPIDLGLQRLICIILTIWPPKYSSGLSDHSDTLHSSLGDTSQFLSWSNIRTQSYLPNHGITPTEFGQKWLIYVVLHIWPPKWSSGPDEPTTSYPQPNRGRISIFTQIQYWVWAYQSNCGLTPIQLGQKKPVCNFSPIWWSK